MAMGIHIVINRSERLVGSGIVSDEKLAAQLTTLPEGELLLRGDSVAFPPGGVGSYARSSGFWHSLPR